MGLRRSQSIRSTRQSMLRDVTVARLTEAVVLPSPGKALVITRVVMGFSAERASIRPRNARNCSAT